MDMNDIFRSFFGLGRRPRRDHHDDFQVQVPGQDRFGFGDDEDCDCDGHDNGNGIESEFPFFFGKAGSEIDDMFRHFHGDMHQQMESLHRQMEDMMKGFGTIASDHFPPAGRPNITDQPNDSNPNNRVWFFGNPEIEPEKKGARDSMLKPGDNSPKSPIGRAGQDDGSYTFSFNNPFKKTQRDSPNGGRNEDTDLDGKVSGADLLDLIKRQDETDKSPQRSGPARDNFFSDSSVTVTTVWGPDGKVEQKKVVRDSSGREESTVSRSVDGQSYTVTTITGPQGVEEKREDFENVDQDNINKFKEKWNSEPAPQQPGHPSIFGPASPPSRLHPKDFDIFSRFFK